MVAPEATMPVRLDLSDLDVEDGPSLARWVSELRARAEREPLVLDHCPQLLAHTLYKAGVLGHGRITLARVREEEPYG
jgi:hypothetical protein